MAETMIVRFNLARPSKLLIIPRLIVNWLGSKWSI